MFLYFFNTPLPALLLLLWLPCFDVQIQCQCVYVSECLYQCTMSISSIDILACVALLSQTSRKAAPLHESKQMHCIVCVCLASVTEIVKSFFMKQSLFIFNIIHKNYKKIICYL